MATPRAPFAAGLLVAASTAGALLLLWSYTLRRKRFVTENTDLDGDATPGDHVSTQALCGRKREADSDDDVSLPPHIERSIMKERKRQEKIKHLAMKKPMYDNVRMLDPQGELLCQISEKKGNWYVAKELADWTEHDGRCIKLRFEPKNRSSRGESGLYVRSDKKNICVVCGDNEYFMRHYVVPYAYRTLFPEQFKSKLSHDIVILCPNCHLVCDQERQKRMKEIEDSYRGLNAEPQFLVDQSLYHVRSKALALLRWREKIPTDKIAEYDKLVRRHLNLTDVSVELTPQQLQKAADVDYRIENPNYIPGPEIVVKNLNNDEEKIASFVRGWRRHFLETMHPQHLPVGWGVESSVVCGSD